MNSSVASLTEFLSRMEEASSQSELRDRLLWPTTPINDQLQSQIRAMVGTSDLEVSDPRSRPSILRSVLHRLRNECRLNDNFTLLDIACGDARLLMEVKREFPDALCCGLDCHMGDFATHVDAASFGVRLYRGFLQELVCHSVPARFDIVLMLNTFRSWQTAHLRSDEQELPRQVESWLRASARFAIVTAAPPQIERLRESCPVEDLAKGEENSRFILWQPDKHLETRSEDQPHDH